MSVYREGVPACIDCGATPTKGDIYLVCVRCWDRRFPRHSRPSKLAELMARIQQDEKPALPGIDPTVEELERLFADDDDGAVE